ncbi:MAG TPA: hypothetical protein VE007_07515 [Thermoanaerobaculia bacterium]|nr:hypothetical protein [Thermoanaerobaculia bacterium]
MWKKWAIAAGVLLLLIAGTGVALIGPRNVIGMIRYDKRQEGKLKVGDRAPDVTLVGLDGQSNVRIADRIGRRPLVLVFGSYT